jgi:hypothetical protein
VSQEVEVDQEGLQDFKRVDKRMRDVKSGIESEVGER